jgi:phage terminase small subunit
LLLSPGPTRGNQTQAYIAAGYSVANMQPSTIRDVASRLRHTPHIAAAIENRLYKRDITVNRWLEELRRRAFGDVREVVQWDASGVRITPSDDLSDESAALIDGVEETIIGSGPQQTRTIKIKLADRQRALETLGQYLRAIKPDGDTVNILVLLRAAAENVKSELDRLARRHGRPSFLELPAGGDSRTPPVDVGGLAGATGTASASGPVASVADPDGARLGENPHGGSIHPVASGNGDSAPDRARE